MSNLVLIHTVSPLVEVFKKLCSQKLADVQIIHILDEPLVKTIQNRGSFAEEDTVRLQTHISMAEKVNAQVILVTCSTISPLVDKIHTDGNVPVLKIDDAMIASAVDKGSTIGIAATSPTTLEPTSQALERQAQIVNKKIKTSGNDIILNFPLPAIIIWKSDAHVLNKTCP